MAALDLEPVLTCVRRLSGAELTDAQLLSRFTAQREEEAFGVLLERHGRLVWSVCRRVLPHAQDAEDAFQATFLVLARQAGGVRNGAALASWLHGVALRIAHKARCRAAAQAVRTPPAAPKATTSPEAEAALHELQAILHEEVRRLPEKLRAPFVLCCLEGRSKPEAARELGWKEGTVSGRLAQARQTLRERLARRGLEPTVIDGPATGAVPGELVRSALAGAVQGRVAATVAALADGAGSAAAGGKLKALVALLTMLALPLGGWWLVVGGWSKPLQPTTNHQSPTTNQPATDAFGDPLPPGAVARLGTRRLLQEDRVVAVAFSGDSRVLASLGGNGVRFWEAKTGKPAGGRKAAAEGGTGQLVWSRDGQWLATGHSGSIDILGADAVGKPDAPALRLGKDALFPAAFAPDGKVLFTAGPNAAVLAWDRTSGRQLRVVAKPRPPNNPDAEPPLEEIRKIAVAPDGKTIAVGGMGGWGHQTVLIDLWDTASGELLWEVKLSNGGHYFGDLAFAPDGKTIAVASGAVRLWDVRTGKERPRLPDDCRGSRLAFTPDGRLFVLGPGGLSLWDLEGGKRMRTFEESLSAPGTSSLAVSPDGQRVAVGYSVGVVMWDATTGKLLPGPLGNPGRTETLTFTPDGKQIVNGGQYIAPRLWDVAGGQLVREPEGGFNGRTSVVVSPDGQIAAVWWYNVLRLIDLPSGKDLRRVPAQPGQRAEIRVFAFAPDGKALLTITWGEEGRFDLWLLDAATGRELRHGELEGALVCAVAFAPDGKSFATIQNGGRIRLWNAATFKESRSFQVADLGEAPIFWLAFSPDGRLLAFNTPREVVLAEADTGKVRHRLGGHTDGWHGDEPGWRFAFSADGRTLAAAGRDDRELRLWEVASGKERLRFPAQGGAIRSIAFSGDGRYLATGTSDTTVLIWDLPRLPLLGRTVAEPAPQDVGRLCADLDGADAVAAYRAVAILRRYPATALPGITAQLRDVGDPKVENQLRLRLVRCLEVLEGMGTPEARRAVDQVAKTAVTEDLSRDARATLARMK
jgi:RNA polymerase sigma factor (sigma-70 family)